MRAYAEEESAAEEDDPGAPYPAILKRVHDRLAGRFGRGSAAGLDELGTAFSESVGAWPAFPDSGDALRFLGSHYRLVILSNVHRRGIEASIRTLGADFDAVYTAEEIGSYKPDPKNFEFLLARLRSDFGLGAEDVLHTAQSLYHDHVPARALGLASAWIDRQRLSEGGDWGATRELTAPPEPDFVFFTLGEMADAVRLATD